LKGEHMKDLLLMLGMSFFFGLFFAYIFPVLVLFFLKGQL